MVPETAREIGLFVPVDEVFPDMKGTQRELMQLLAMLSRDDTLFQCARINTIVSGFGDFDNVPRQQQALNMLCGPMQIARINDFANRHKSSGPPLVFFRGQMLELMRWAAMHCKNLPDDGTTYTDPAFRERFAKAALVAGGLWSARTYRDTLSSPGTRGRDSPSAPWALCAKVLRKPISHRTLASQSDEVLNSSPNTSRAMSRILPECSSARRGSPCDNI